MLENRREAPKSEQDKGDTLFGKKNKLAWKQWFENHPDAEMLKKLFDVKYRVTDEHTGWERALIDSNKFGGELTIASTNSSFLIEWLRSDQSSTLQDEDVPTVFVDGKQLKRNDELSPGADAVWVLEDVPSDELSIELKKGKETEIINI